MLRFFNYMYHILGSYWLPYSIYQWESTMGYWRSQKPVFMGSWSEWVFCTLQTGWWNSFFSNDQRGTPGGTFITGKAGENNTLHSPISRWRMLPSGPRLKNAWTIIDFGWSRLAWMNEKCRLSTKLIVLEALPHQSVSWKEARYLGGSPLWNRHPTIPTVLTLTLTQSLRRTYTGCLQKKYTHFESSIIWKLLDFILRVLCH